ncbi:Exodeoxyribonuclease 7 large subunit [Alphaproteobacteria bacterium]
MVNIKDFVSAHSLTKQGLGGYEAQAQGVLDMQESTDAGIVLQLSARTEPPKKIKEVVYTVSGFSDLLKQIITGNFTKIKIRGEISNLKIAASGHIYFSLKDEKAVLNAICWKGVQLPVKLEDGLEVICSGNITVYPERSVYQLIVQRLEVSGTGALLALLEKRKQQLTVEGLFDAERKKSLPTLPKVIGVITSLHGAVIKDILHRISDRYPTQVLIWNVQVQGMEAAEQVVAAIRGFHNLPAHLPTPDVLIIARGGGSIEDLWPFNDEGMVRAVAASRIPIISAVGHETDYTLVDFAADLRAPTPTAAAEMVVPVRLELQNRLGKLRTQLSLAAISSCKQKQLRLSNIAARLSNSAKTLYKVEQHLSALKCDLLIALNNLHKNKQHRLEILRHGLSLRPITAELASKTQNLSRVMKKLNQLMVYSLEHKTQTLDNLQKLLTSYNHTEVLKRGFAIVKSGTHVINSYSKLQNNMRVTLEFYDGSKDAIVLDSA